MDFKERIVETLRTKYAQELTNEIIESIDMAELFEVAAKIEKLSISLARDLQDAFINTLTDIVYKTITLRMQVKLSTT
jgi:hypothetical protein